MRVTFAIFATAKKHARIVNLEMCVQIGSFIFYVTLINQKNLTIIIFSRDERYLVISVIVYQVPE